MSKKGDLRVLKANPEPPAPVLPASTQHRRKIDDPGNPHFRQSRVDRYNITGYFEKPVKKQFSMLAVERDMSQQDLLAEALNDLFAKYNLPELARMEGKR